VRAPKTPRTLQQEPPTQQPAFKSFSTVSFSSSPRLLHTRRLSRNPFVLGRISTNIFASACHPHPFVFQRRKARFLEADRSAFFKTVLAFEICRFGYRSIYLCVCVCVHVYIYVHYVLRWCVCLSLDGSLFVVCCFGTPRPNDDDNYSVRLCIPGSFNMPLFSWPCGHRLRLFTPNLLLSCACAQSRKFLENSNRVHRVEITAYIFRDDGKHYIGSAFPGEA